MAKNRWDNVGKKAERAKAAIKKALPEKEEPPTEPLKILRVRASIHATAKAKAATAGLSLQNYLEQLIESDK